LKLNEYQRRAKKTNNIPSKHAKIVPLLGLVGEVGTLQTEYKKYLRDGKGYEVYEDQVAEELGDILWYVSTVATSYDLDLAKIAKDNIEKIESRWLPHQAKLFDEGFPKDEQLPRKFSVKFSETKSGDRKIVRATINGVNVGDSLTDNANEDDGYRYHDIFHLSYAAILGWSPVIRKLLKRKRKSNPKVDEVEDGARAAILEEAIAAAVYQHAKDNKLYADHERLDYEVLRIAQRLVAGLEVHACPLYQWERAIMRGYEIFRLLTKNRGGIVHIDLIKRNIFYRKS
jgi:NTP pyrophosphatase (non-canonical NTP hydrolase)